MIAEFCHWLIKLLKAMTIMKKMVLIIYLLAVILFGTSTFVNAIELLDCMVPNQSDTYIAPQGSKEELYQDIFMTMLTPYIQKAVDDYYGKYYAVDPVAEILSIDRPNGYRTFYFIIKLQVIPYQGAHNAVGID